MDFAIQWLRAIPKLELPVQDVEEEGRTIRVRYTPLGVAVGIVPWNYPILLAVGKIAPAVVTGNAIVIKPSPFTPYGGLKLVELAQRFFPPGVIQALSGGDDLGPWLTAHPTPNKISFTGSTFTGKKVMESASKTLKRVTLELGGKDPAIICEDVNIAEVAPKVGNLHLLILNTQVDLDKIDCSACILELGTDLHCLEAYLRSREDLRRIQGRYGQGHRTAQGRRGQRDRRLPWTNPKRDAI